MRYRLSIVLLLWPIVGWAHNSAEHALKYLNLAAPNGQRPGVETQKLNASSRTDLDFVPGIGQGNHGFPLGYLGLDAKRAAHALLRSELSPKGYLLANSIMSLEEILRQTQSGGSQVRLVEDYALEVFGDPKGDIWAWKFEGHHLSVNLTYSGDETRVTPLFIGGSPAEVRNGPLAGMSLFAEQTRLATELVESLSTKQVTAAIGGDLDGNSLVSRGPERSIETGIGLKLTAMTSEQENLVLKLVETWTENLRPEHAKAEFTRVASNKDHLRFHWRGGIDQGNRQYFQITGPTMYIQFDMLPETLEPGSPHNHVHSIWGDPIRDFGRDLLEKHLEKEHQ